MLLSISPTMTIWIYITKNYLAGKSVNVNIVENFFGRIKMELRCFVGNIEVITRWKLLVAFVWIAEKPLLQNPKVVGRFDAIIVYSSIK